MSDRDAREVLSGKTADWTMLAVDQGVMTCWRCRICMSDGTGSVLAGKMG
jgi:hypothetical protein